MGYYIAVSPSVAPDRVRRFVRTFNGIGSVSFGNKASVSTKVGNKYTGSRQIEVCKSTVDYMREAAASGKAPAFWAHVQVEDYEGVVHYPEKDAPKGAGFVDDPPDFYLAWDNTWRRAPIEQFVKTFRGWKYSYAFVDAAGTPRAETVERNTKTELAGILFESMFPVFKELVQTFEEVPPPPAESPVVEKTYTQAELNAIEPMAEATYNKLRADKAHYLYETDIAFRTAVDKMWALQARVKEAFDRKLAEEDRQKALEALKKKHAESNQ